MNEQLNITEIKSKQNDIASRFDCQVMWQILSDGYEANFI